jgi:diguanylate cyclase (GGDEF)-like protein
MFLLAVFCTLAICAVSVWALSMRAQVRELTDAVTEAESRHLEFLEQTEQGGAIRKRIEEQLLEKQRWLDQLAHHYQLTGLPNRLYLAAHLPGAIEEARRRRLPLAVMFLDLDRFKHVNDTYGHETGDKLLQAVAQRIREAVRNDDIVVRMGGDEFVVIMSAIRTSTHVSETAMRITTALNAPIVIDGRPLVTTVSVGVSVFPRDGDDVGSLLRHSDTAMYQAKDRGRNNVQVFSPAMDRALKERVAMEASLRAAIRERQLDVHYQPLIDIETREVIALEALIRWYQPDEGLISPMRFIPIAEETGLIVEIGDFVLRRIASDMVDWRAQGARLVPVAMNVSADQLRRGDLHASIVSVLREHDLGTELLQIELTESAMFEQSEGKQGESDPVAQLRQLGIRVALDDFGTGYSSLSYLKRWHVDHLKIDRSFVRDLVTDSNDHAIVGAILAMARHLHINVIAEGVEGWPQLETLRRLGCRYAQGYLFAEPISAHHCRALLNGRPMSVIDSDHDLLTAAQA